MAVNSPLLALDTFGQVSVVVAILISVAGSVGFWLLSRRNARTGLVIAIFLFVASHWVEDGGSRLLHGVLGLLSLIGLVGGVISLVTLARAPLDH